jgi:hypothetical protein
VIVVRVKVSRGIEPFSPMEIDSADTSQPPNGEICMDKSQILPNNPARQWYRYTSVPIEAAKVPIEAAFTFLLPFTFCFFALENTAVCQLYGPTFKCMYSNTGKAYTC